VGPVLFRRLLERFETPARVFSASAGQLAEVRGMTPQIVTSLATPACRRFAEEECRKIADAGIRLLSFLDADYPRRLFEIGDPPPLLYLRGTLPAWDPALAVVGSRRATREGLKVAERLSTEIAAAGIVVVSGLARGIDSAAHRGALAGGGATVAVLGCGVDVAYPPENRDLADQIALSGCIISEFPMGTQPLAEHFPRRNRIISGLSRGVLVVEAVEKSGSLITASYALDQGREVMAIPGPISSPANRGSNRLIKQGAQLVDCIEDILEATRLDRLRQHPSLFDPVPMAPRSTLTPREAAVYELVAQGPRHLDEITQALELTPGEVSAMVLGLELKGMLVQLPGSYYSLS
jgi:DNA processing protein